MTSDHGDIEILAEADRQRPLENVCKWGIPLEIKEMNNWPADDAELLRGRPIRLVSNLTGRRLGQPAKSPASVS